MNQASSAIRGAACAGALIALAAGLGGCTVAPSVPAPSDGSRVLGRGDGMIVVLPGRGDTLQSLASRYLGDPDRAWEVADANNLRAVVPGRDILIPLHPLNPTGVYENGYQVVPILSYHRFDRSGKRLALSPEAFREQLEYLRDYDYRVVPLADVAAYLRGEHALPLRAVAITVDDGYRSTYEVAYPLLLEFGYPATVFVYSEFAGKGGMSYAQLREMQASGLVDIQSHSKSHANLTESPPGEARAAYARRVKREIDEPRARLSREVSTSVRHYAYPYGDTNALVMKALESSGHELGLTVVRRPNAFFAHPFALGRSMVFSDRGMGGFVSDLKTFESAALK